MNAIFFSLNNFIFCDKRNLRSDHPVMYLFRCFVVGSLYSSGVFSIYAEPEKVEAFAGGHAILPCSLKTSRIGPASTVEWSKVGLKSKIVFLYRDGCETFGMKDVDFEFRTSLFMREVKNGNVSLRISNLKLSDAGIYNCSIFERNKLKETANVKLLVAAVSEPKLEVVFIENERVTVTCQASCWMSAPKINILDNEGNDIITDEEPNQEQNVRGCYAKQTFPMQDSAKRVVCRVKQPHVDQNRAVEIQLSDNGHLSSRGRLRGNPNV
ncbi:butyrophilin-like protein 8 isoform X2 [Cyprinodon tularosa]|uniref:butyrophilin-like protein 8 isoform X2 n=1 Tax=Cyprinodon tularosa TaxID=77115 RepID=UPI0018E22D93|nr:butyrophilin-like protein 8 isoform X2 [Cyprinodon tularosa]